MPRSIKETPILYDEDAYRFEMAAHNVMPLPVEEQEEMWASLPISEIDTPLLRKWEAWLRKKYGDGARSVSGRPSGS